MNLLRRVWLVVASVYVYPLVQGVLGALAFWEPLKFFIANKAASKAFLKCFQLNGALFLGSMGLMHFGVSPLLRSVVRAVLNVAGFKAAGDSEVTVGEVPADDGSNNNDQQQFLEASAELISSAIFHALWLYPVYCISFILNATWYQEVADEAQQYFVPAGQSGATTGLGFLKMVRDEIFRLLLVLGFVVQASLLGAVPAPFGPILQFACYSWLFSFYCFEYGWGAKGWRLLRRTNHFERNWLFYLGFGVPGAAATTYFPMLINGGVYALVFPLFIAVGAYCDSIHRYRWAWHTVQPSQPKRDNCASSKKTALHVHTIENDDQVKEARALEAILDQFRFQMPIFKFPVLLATILVKTIQLCCCTKWSGAKGLKKSQAKNLARQHSRSRSRSSSLSKVPIATPRNRSPPDDEAVPTSNKRQAVRSD
eukprot:INCI18964.1.p1 GENE.INCI18964.1~~INCI18964.1.p1  ORF type:complete len:425 (+),score=61.95 INCI18964.1:212-1486(+)